ncbi:MAG: LamG-like jellyroll fold domain-containing protein, partial [Nitrososphaerales archaeon]
MTLVGYWTFNQHLMDEISGNSFNLSLSFGTELYTPAQLNHGFDFNGTTGLKHPDNVLLRTQPAMSIAFWFKTDSLTGEGGIGRRLVTKFDSVSNEYIIHLIPTSNLIAASFKRSGVSAQRLSSTSLSTGTTYFIVFDYDGTTTNCYINNVLD